MVQPRKIMRTLGNRDTYDLMIMIRWDKHMSPRSVVQHSNPTYCVEKKKITAIINHILDTLSKEYTQQRFTHAAWIFTVCVQCMWANLHDDANEK